MPKKAAASSRNKFLNKVHEHLLETKSKLLEEMETELKAHREGNQDEGRDAYDLASEERDREINFILADREQAKIKEIDDALARFADGSYGVCESCGLEIGEERLDALPFTRVCRDCQQDREREAKSQRNYDSEDRGYRKVGSTDGDEENM
jgi:DnaK suppressor protein